MKDVYVFLGPSCPLGEAKKILPSVRYLPPVRCGNILQLLRLKPRCIVIIDGLFENTAAVWHKEILYALHQGVIVVGASSMGALRAAELHSFGMHGVGRVFEAYRDGEIDGDDEVAILHQPAERDYMPSTDAMINIRMTVKNAVEQSLLSSSQGEAIIAKYKSMFYANRVLDREESWCRDDIIVDQKRLDAIAALEYVAEKTLESPSPFSFSHSSLLSALQFFTASQPFIIFRDWLPRDEKVMLVGRLFDQYYPLIKRLARIMAVANKLPQRFSDAKKHLLAMLKISGEYMALKKLGDPIEVLKAKDPLKYEILQYTAQYWATIDASARKHDVVFSQKTKKEMLLKFRAHHRILNPLAFIRWKRLRNVKKDEFEAIVEMSVLFEYFIKSHNLEGLNIPHAETSTWWLLEAAKLTGFYGIASRLLEDPEALQKRAQALVKSYEKHPAPLALQLDFSSGIIELNDFVFYTQKKASQIHQENSPEN